MCAANMVPRWFQSNHETTELVNVVSIAPMGFLHLVSNTRGKKTEG